jgi:MFS family permease
MTKLKQEILILTTGRTISQMGHGLLLVSAPIFFVNQVGLSTTEVGIGLSSASLAGVIGRFLGGSWADSPRMGRRRTILLASLLSAWADGILAFTEDFSHLVLGNILMGWAVGISLPALQAILADLSSLEERNETFALIRFAERVGLNLGVVLAGIALSIAEAKTSTYRLLFLLDGLSFLLFFALIYFTLRTTNHFHKHQPQIERGWAIVLKDRRLLVFLGVGILVTTYIAQIQSILPLYFSNWGFPATKISDLFTWYIFLTILCQLPVAKLLNRFSRLRALMFSLLLYGGGFILIWLAGVMSSHAIVVAFLALAMLAVALAAYDPIASAFVADLAPESLRGIYLSLNSQSWAIGYAIGPLLGGWALNQSSTIAHGFWLIAAACFGCGILILQSL